MQPRENGIVNPLIYQKIELTLYYISSVLHQVLLSDEIIFNGMILLAYQLPLHLLHSVVNFDNAADKMNKIQHKISSKICCTMRIYT